MNHSSATKAASEGLLIKEIMMPAKQGIFSLSNFLNLGEPINMESYAEEYYI